MIMMENIFQFTPGNIVANGVFVLIAIQIQAITRFFLVSIVMNIIIRVKLIKIIKELEVTVMIVRRAIAAILNEKKTKLLIIVTQDYH